MIEFKRDFEKILPYNREKYIDYLADAADSSVKWYGGSFQAPAITDQKDVSLQHYLEMYEPLFKNIVLQLDNGASWIVNHDDKNLPWFPNEYDNLPYLRTLFKKNNVLNTYEGALVFSTLDLVKYSKELISYPFTVTGKKDFLYKNLDISNNKLQTIIKISGHLNIDFLSTEQLIFEKIINADFANGFVVKEYRGN